MLKKVVASIALATLAFSAGVMANTSMFADVSADDWFAGGAMFAADAGLMTGQGDGETFDPAGSVNRAQLAVVLQRMDAYIDAKIEAEMKGEEMTEEKEMELMTIAGIVTEDENFSTLLAALNAADLASVFAGETEYTVFAPTNAAFDALEEGALDALLADPAALAEVLKYHVVEGKVMASAVIELDSATTLEGSDVAIVVEEGKVMVDGATVTQTDIMASNGVIHVIDSVLLPSAE